VNTFHDWKPPVSENILRDNGGFTLARLDLKRDGAGWRVLKQEILPMTANTAPADPAVVDKIGTFETAIRNADKPLGDLKESLDEQKILTVFLGALTQIPGTQAVAYSQQSIREDWPSGPLTSSRVFNTIPWTTPLVQLTLTPGQIDRLGKYNGMVILKQANVPAGQPLTVTTSKFFASLLAQELGLPHDAIRDAGAGSEFDYFVQYLAKAPRPLPTETPGGWIK
jgi:hypothetical protein